MNDVGKARARILGALRFGSPKEFWNRIKAISVKEIALEANRPLSVAIVGDTEAAEQIRAGLYQTHRSMIAPPVLPASPFIQVYASMSPEDGFPPSADLFDFVIDAGGGRAGAGSGYTTPIYSVNEIGGWDATLDRILEDRPAVSLALARNFPAFRSRAAGQIIQQTAMTNAEFSLITGVASAVPLFDLILPANALSDILILTKNQIMMSLRLAAVYGLEVNYRSRMKELTPILINAFSWRAIARELVGAVPAIGFVFRAMISYAGTVAVGKAAQLYYETGEAVTRSQAQRWYREAYQGSKERIRALSGRIRTGRRGPGGDRARALRDRDADAN